MKDYLFMVCLLVLITLLLGCGYKLGENVFQDKMINECQKNLPRNQYCTIIAVPEKDLDNLED